MILCCQQALNQACTVLMLRARMHAGPVSWASCLTWSSSWMSCRRTWSKHAQQLQQQQEQRLASHNSSSSSSLGSLICRPMGPWQHQHPMLVAGL